MKIGQLIRVAYRVPVALLWTLGVHYLTIRIPQIFRPRRRFINGIGLWGRGLAKIMGIRIHCVNPKPEQMGDVIVANHMGFLDIPILLSFFPAVFVIKMEMRKVPYFGRCLRHQGHVFVARTEKKSRHASRSGIKNVLTDGDRIILFPEGKASPGVDRLPFAPFTFSLAKQLNKTVQACVLDYIPNRQLLKWDVTQRTFPQLMNLLGRPTIDVSIEFLPPEHVDDPVETAERYRTTCQQRLENGPQQKIVV